LIAQIEQIFQDFCDLKDRAALHFFQIFPVSSHPVVVFIDHTVLKNPVQLVDLFIGNDLSQSNTGDRLKRNHDAGVIGKDPQIIKLDLAVTDGSLIDILNDGQPVVRVDDLISDS
jgi:hypothetical protein